MYMSSLKHKKIRKRDNNNNKKGESERDYELLKSKVVKEKRLIYKGVYNVSKKKKKKNKSKAIN